MLCKRCHEAIETGEAMRAEPTFAGSTHHYFYHCGCYTALKEERQSETAQLQLQLEDARTIQAARSVGLLKGGDPSKQGH